MRYQAMKLEQYPLFLALTGTVVVFYSVWVNAFLGTEVPTCEVEAVLSVILVLAGLVAGVITCRRNPGISEALLKQVSLDRRLSLAGASCIALIVVTPYWFAAYPSPGCQIVATVILTLGYSGLFGCACALCFLMTVTDKWRGALVLGVCALIAIALESTLMQHWR